MYYALEQDRDDDTAALLAARGIRMTLYRHMRGHIFRTKAARDQYVKDFEGHPDYLIWSVDWRRAYVVFPTLGSITRHYPERYYLLEPPQLNTRGKSSG